MKMRIPLHVLAALAVASAMLAMSIPTQAAPLNVLFIGNSHTYFNDMPTVFQDISTSAGKTTPQISSSTIGGYTLDDHLRTASTLNAIMNGYGSSNLKWDVVVLQEHSAYPAYAEVDTYYRDLFQSASVGLYDYVKTYNPDAKVISFETPAWNQAYFDTSGGNNYMGSDALDMQARVRKWGRDTAFNYIPANSTSARKNDCVIAPIGDAWERNYLDPQAIMLHAPDYYHPLYPGTYLGALVMYATVYNATPTGIGYTGDLTTATANYLQGIAAAAFTPPSLSISAPSVSSASTGPVTYTIRYTYTGAAAITLSPSNITLNKTGTANGTIGVSGDSATARTVTISGITGNGTLGISISAETASNLAGSAPAAGPSQTFTVANTPPSLLISAPSVSSTSTGPVAYTVTYSGATAITLSPSNITLNKDGTANGTVGVYGDGARTRIVMITSGITGNGTLGISIAAGTASNGAGQAPAAGPSQTFRVDNTRPTVTINQAAGQPDPTNTSPINFRVEFSEPVVDFATGDVTLSGTAGSTTAIVTGGSATYNVAVTGMTGLGTVIATIAAGVAHDTAHNVNAASTSTDNQVTVGEPPAMVSLTPNSGFIATSLKQTLASVYADPNGYADLAQCYLLINTTLSGASAGYMMYDANTNLLHLRNDANTGWGAGCALGSAYVLENSQCILYCAETTKSGSGNYLTVNWKIEFKPAMSGRACKAWMSASDDERLTVPWVVRGELKLGQPQPPTIISLAPNSGFMPTSVKQTFASVYADPNGYADLAQCYLLINTTLSGASAVYVMYDANTNLLYLRNDANTGWGTGCALGSANVLENSQCKLYCAETTRSGSGSNLTVYWRIEFKPAMSGRACKAWLAAYDDEGLVAPWVVKREYYFGQPQPPTIVNLAPNSGAIATGVKQPFESVYADPNGYADLAQCYLLINTTLSGASAVYVMYDANTNRLYLRNDANTGWGSGRAPGSADAPLENSQCVLYCSETTKSGSGNNLMIRWKIEFKPAMSGKACKAWMAAYDDEGLVAPWVVKGEFRF